MTDIVELLYASARSCVGPAETEIGNHMCTAAGTIKMLRDDVSHLHAALQRNRADMCTAIGNENVGFIITDGHMCHALNAVHEKRLAEANATIAELKGKAAACASQLAYPAEMGPVLALRAIAELLDTEPTRLSVKAHIDRFELVAERLRFLEGESSMQLERCNDLRQQTNEKANDATHAIGVVYRICDALDMPRTTNLSKIMARLAVKPPALVADDHVSNAQIRAEVAEALLDSIQQTIAPVHPSLYKFSGSMIIRRIDSLLAAEASCQGLRDVIAGLKSLCSLSAADDVDMLRARISAFRDGEDRRTAYRSAILDALGITGVLCRDDVGTAVHEIVALRKLADEGKRLQALNAPKSFDAVRITHAQQRLVDLCGLLRLPSIREYTGDGFTDLHELITLVDTEIKRRLAFAQGTKS